MLVLIFGTFNPITNAHIQMGYVAKKKLPDAQIIYIPSKDRFLESWKKMKSRSILEGTHRVKLMKEALKPHGFTVDDIEVSTHISGKTYDTIAAIKQKYGTDDIYICMGTDKVGELHTWYRGEELIAENKYLIIDRDGNTLDNVIESSESAKSYHDHFIKLENARFNDVSASRIRKAYIDKDLSSIQEYVPENVYKYLLENEGVYS